MQSEWIPVVMVVLSVSTIVVPIMFGFTLWKLSSIFVTKEQFMDFKANAEERREEMIRRLDNIDHNILELLRK